MKWLANCLYLMLLCLLFPWLVYRSIRTGRYREGWSQKLLGRVQPCSPEHPVLWLHAVSVGEVLQLPGIVERWQAKHADWKIVVTTTTTTGFKVALEKFPDCTVEYCPLDFSWAVENAIQRFRPHLMGLVELELWPNLITCLHQHQVPVVIINGRLSAKSHRGYKKLKPLIKWLLHRLTYITVQNQDYADRFLDLGADPSRLTVTGSIKYDGVPERPESSATSQMQQELGLKVEDLLFLAGSTHEPEEQIAIEAWKTLHQEFPQLKLAIAPRHAERFEEIAEQLTAQGIVPLRRSQPDSTGTESSGVILLDTLGELKLAWSMARIAFVGGSFTKRGGQNMIEPAAYGIPVMVGPGTRNFAETVRLLKQADGILELSTPEEMVPQLRTLLTNLQQAEEMGARAKAFVDSQRGATDRVVELMSQAIAGDAKNESRQVA